MGGRGGLVGRERELAVIGGFLDGPGAGLLLTGEAGVGKTALWRQAAEDAGRRGGLVLPATPGEGEERLSFGVVNDLLRDVATDAVDLRPPVFDALESALLRRVSAEPVEALLVHAGVHDVLLALARERSVFVFVDDTQWADPASLGALLHSARRLTSVPVRFVLARRAGFERTPLEALLARRDLVVVEPRTLDEKDTARLLRQELELLLTPRVIRLVHEQARGNPLFVLEIGRALVASGVPDVGQPLAVPTEMAAALGLRVAGLAEDLRELLLTVALEPHATDAELTTMFGLESVERAVTDRLVVVAPDGRARPWHPLLAAAARESATPARRREVHRRLAGVVPTEDQRLRHAALAAPGPDEELAEALSAAVVRAGERGAADTALDLAEMTLTLTPASSDRRPARVLQLATQLKNAGEGRRLTALLAEEVEQMPVGPERGQARILSLEGIIDHADDMYEIVDRAEDECGGDPEVLAEALVYRSFIAGWVKVTDIHLALQYAEAAAERGAPTEAIDWCHAILGREPAGPPGPPFRFRWLWRGEIARSEQATRADLAEADESGQLYVAMELGDELAKIVVRAGRVTEAASMVDAQGDVDQSALVVPDAQLLRAEFAMASGDVASARYWADLLTDVAVAQGFVAYRLGADRVLGVAALLVGEHEEAVSRFTEVLAYTRGANIGDPGMHPVAPDLAESLALLGRFGEASEVTSWLAEVSAEQQHPWGTAMAERSGVLIGLLEGRVPAPEASAGMREVAGRLEALGLLLDAGRAHLVLGSALRRQRQWGLARDHLAEAARRFDGLGADGWAAVTRGELERVGGRRRSEHGELTATEQTIARLAADGLANKEIARRSGVAVGTVERHLSRAYVKLGVRSRSQLAGALPRAPSDETDMP